ncbi:cation:proton antiporter [Naasia lichenicola]|uniref:Sodium:proton antiporter n=1 Tax=Naasia lichenicola TaxID=2565933 RepID=A0A4V3WTT8_9MICO|nr:sodium:proton antiporter [Naasia lichenicola]THG33227.1 sodium:proton antiporter [Naasia lichenicola]
MIDPIVLAVGFIAIIVVAAAFGRKFDIAAPLILLVVGVVIGFLPFVPPIEIEYEVILTGVLPPLLYAAAIKVPIRDFRRNLAPIAGLSVTLVIISAVVCGVIIHWLLPGLGLPMSIALGAVIAPTDAVAATSIAKRLGLPDRLVTVLEGESLVNDATALVLLRTAIAAAAGSFALWPTIGTFVWAVVGGIVSGVIVGYLASLIRRKLRDAVLTTTVSLAVPFIAYLPAEHFGASGVLAVVVAGLIVGHNGARGLTAQQRFTERNIWETVQFILEQGVFLAMGLQLFGLVEELDNTGAALLQPILIGLLLVAVLIVLRTIFVGYLLWSQRRNDRRALQRGEQLPLFEERMKSMPEATGEREQKRNRLIRRRINSYTADLEFLRKEGLNRRGGLVLSWAGMRGVVTLAAAQSLQIDDVLTPSEQATVVIIAFTVAAVTLFGLGGSLGPIIRLSKVQRDDEAEKREEFRSLMMELNKAQLAVLDDPEATKVQGRPVSPELIENLRRVYSRTVPSADEVEEAEQASQALAIDERIAVEQRMRLAARDALREAQAVGTYSSKTLQTALDLLDIDDARTSRITGD